MTKAMNFHDSFDRKNFNWDIEFWCESTPKSNAKKTLDSSKTTKCSLMSDAGRKFYSGRPHKQILIQSQILIKTHLLLRMLPLNGDVCWTTIIVVECRQFRTSKEHIWTTNCARKREHVGNIGISCPTPSMLNPQNKQKKFDRKTMPTCACMTRNQESGPTHCCCLPSSNTKRIKTIV
jgi:hypothetical protein